MKCLILLIILLNLGCYKLVSNFKVGDCIVKEWSESPENWEKRANYLFSEKILEIGRNNYRTTYWYGANNKSLIEKYENSLKINSTNLYWKKVDCEELKKLGK